MKYHPNIKPVPCKDVEDIKLLADEMRQVCLRDPDKINGYVASTSVKEAKQKSRDLQQNMIESDHLRFILLDHKIINVVFTLLETPEKWEWNLSISHATVFGPQRVENKFASMIVEAFMGSDYQEVEPKSVWKTVRHFIQLIKI